MDKRYVKKTILLNQAYVDKAVKLFNVKTEKEAVNRALEIAVEEEEIINAHREISGEGTIERVFK
ncbi:MAG: type II toxin-antitoxin system VapB family antitoxin [Spirochaetota bacterium]